MRKINKLLISVLFAGALMACGKTTTGEANYQIIPLPQEISNVEGQPFMLTSATKVVYPEGNEMMKRNAEFLSEYLHISMGIVLEATSTATDDKQIELALGLENDNKEAYRLEVTENKVIITGATEAGVFYGIQTLRKAVPLGDAIASLAAVTINDAPRFGYRGVMLDVARHYQPVAFVKKFIDLLAMHNINRFHWHLTEDQGWRIEIKQYPKLTELGSMRKETVIGNNSPEYDGKPHGGFYTQEEIREIVAYAQERYVTTIPEIDLPGHMMAALTGYPEFGCTGGPYEVATSWGVFDEVLCAGNEGTYTFLENILTEVMEMFPAEYIHIGGDEVPKVRWEECPKCQAKIKELGIKGDDKHTKEHYLQSYLTARIEKFLNDNGRRIIGWDEILEGELAPNATVMSWQGMGGGIQAAQMGHDVIMTPNTYVYFDYYQTANTEDEPTAIGGFLPLEKVYSFEPAPESLTPEQRGHILGAQANLWTEYIPTPEQAEYMLLPRMAALSEVAWSQPEKKDYYNFLTRLPQLTDLYSKAGYNFATHVYDVQAKLEPNFQTNALDVEFSTLADSPIYYTLDGSEPTKSSNEYVGKFTVKEDAKIKAAAFANGKLSSKIFSEEIKMSKSSYKPITMLSTAARGYSFNGAPLLVDGLYGSSNYKTGRWIGFQGADLVVVIDMLQPTEITEVKFNTNVVTGDWIFDAEEVIVETSNDNETFETIVSEKGLNVKEDHWQDVVNHEFIFDATTARYFKVTIKSLSEMPEWHAGKGRGAYVFVDEIALN
jgi:hexosaminidase